jgi:hypothetical protein
MLATALVLSLSGVSAQAQPVAEDDALPVAREVRTVWTGEFGVPRPAAVASTDDAGLVAVGGDGAGVRLAGEDELGTFELDIADPTALAISPDGDLAVVTDDEVVEVPAEQLDDDELVGEGTELPEELTAPGGATFDADGSLLVLDATTGELVETDEGDGGTAAPVPLETDASDLRGLAHNPRDGLLYTLDVAADELLAFDADGTLHETYDTSDLDLLDPQELTFAPTSSTADDPAELNLFIADAGDEELFGGVTEVTLQQVTTAAVEHVTATLVQTIDTSKWVPASPDPSGVTYLPASDRLTVVDSEVNEVTGAGYHGVNVWEVTRQGAVQRGWNTLSFTNEPTGVGHDPATNTLFISTDSGTNGIHIVRAGPDGQFGTSDDTRSFLNTALLGVGDTEDPEFDPSTGHLFFLDGVSTRVYRVDPVDGVFGNGNDLITSFGVGQYGPTDAEGLALDQSRGTLLVGDRRSRTIYEVTKSGQLVRTIDARMPGMTFLSGMSMAPATNQPGRSNIWIVDRAVDNGPDPNENDGKLFEVSVPTSGGNQAPIVSSVTIDQDAPRTNDTLTATVSATDPDGDDVTLSYQWLKNGTVLSGRTSPTLDLSVAGNGDKGDALAVRVTASDGSTQSVPVTSSSVTVVNSPPVFGQNLPNRTDAEGTTVNVNASASDPDGDTLTYSASGLPPGAAISSTTGAITGTIASGAAANSPYATSVTVSDGSSGSGGSSQGISLVQSQATDASGVNSLSLSYAQPPTPGNLLVAFGHYGANRVPTIPPGWSLALESNTGGETVVFYRVAGSNEPSQVTLGASGAALFMSLSIFEYAGLHGVQSEVLDRTVFNSGSNVSTVSTGTLPLTRHPNELLLASVGLNGTRTFQNGWTNGFARRTDERRQTVAERIVSATGNFETTESWTGGTVGTAVGSMVAFRAADGGSTTPGAGASTTANFTWTVTGGGSTSDPQVDSVTITPAEPRTDDTLTATATGSGGSGTLTYAYQWLKNGTALAGETGRTLDLSRPGNGDKGDTLAVRATATDGTATSSPVTSSPVAVINSAPVFGQDLPNRSDAEGAAVSLAAGATDADGDPLTYAATGLPPGVSIDASTGAITGTVAAGAAANSPYPTSVTVRDGAAGAAGTATATDTFTWTVTASATTGIAFRAASSASTQNGTNLSVGRPAGVTTGDVLLATVVARGTPTLTAPPGWTLVRTDTNGTALRQATYWRTAVANEPSSYQWSFSARIGASATVSAYRGVHPTSPVLVHDGQVTASSTTITAPSVSVSVVDALAVAALGIATDASITEPAGMIERVEVVESRGNQRSALASADAVVGSAGASGPWMATATQAAANIGQQVVLRPAGG